MKNIFKIVSIIITLLLIGCKTYSTKQYTITDEKQNYYTDTYLMVGDSIFFNETDWSGKPVRFFKKHREEVVIKLNGER